MAPHGPPPALQACELSSSGALHALQRLLTPYVHLVSPICDHNCFTLAAIRSCTVLRTAGFLAHTSTRVQEKHMTRWAHCGAVLQWEAEPKVEIALDAGFYASFRNVEPTGKRFLLGVDMSASMNGGECAGMQGLTPRDAATAVAMCLKRTETCVHTMAFTNTFLVRPRFFTAHLPTNLALRCLGTHSLCGSYASRCLEMMIGRNRASCKHQSLPCKHNRALHDPELIARSKHLCPASDSPSLLC